VEEWPLVRIALVVTGGVDRSGREKVIPAVLWLIERLARQHEVYVYALCYHQQPCTYPLLGATVRDLGRPAGTRRQYSALLEALRHDGPFDVVHGYWALPAGLVAAAAARRLGVPSVVTCDSGEFSAIPEIEYGLQIKWRQRTAVSAALKLASRVTVCTAFMERLARAHGTIPVVIPLGVDRRVFTPPAQPPAGPPWRLLNVASLNPVKDHRTLIDAFRIVVDRAEDVHLDLAGEDTMHGSVRDAVARLALDDRVTFHGVLASDAVAALYRQAHLFVLSSRHEAAGVVALEAAASCVPVVGTSVGYVADWAPLSARAVPIANPPALADAILSLLTDRAAGRQLAASAHEWAFAHDADWSAAEFARLYASLWAKGGGHRAEG
jgi:glycosyltransferase involved in cell wall biosynthesis